MHKRLLHAVLGPRARRPQRAENTLRAHEAKYRMLFDSIDEGFCIIKILFDECDTALDYRFLDINPAFIKQTGLTDALGKTISELAPKHESFWLAMYGEIARTGTPARFEHQAEAIPSGGWYDVYAFRVGAPEESNVAVVFNDITARKHREQQQVFLVRLSDALRPLTDAVAVQQTAMQLLADQLDVMRATYFEVESDQNTFTLTARYERDAVPIPNQMRLSDFSAELAANYRSGRTLLVCDTEREAQRAAYRNIGVRAWAAVPLVKNGQVVAIVGVHSRTPRDWTDAHVHLLENLAERTWAAVERARAEQALRASEARLQQMVNVPRVGVLTFDYAGTMLHANDAFLAMVGYTRAEFAAKTRTWHAFTPSEYVAASEGVLQQLRETGRGGPYEKEYFRSDGSRLWLMFVAADLGDNTFVEYALDISDRKRAEMDLRESEHHLRVLINNLPGGAVFIVDRNLRYMLAAGAALQPVGRKAEDFIGKTLIEALPPELALEYEQAYRQGLAGKPFEFEHQTYGRSFITRGTPLQSANGDVYAVLAVSYDITARKQAEAAVQQANATLEARVVARTHALSAANATLQDEMTQRVQAEADRAALVAQLITAQEDERHRIARELHDSLGQFLSALKLRITLAQTQVGMPAAVVADLAQLHTIAQQIDQELDRLTMALRPPSLDSLGLGAALESAAQEWSTISGVPVDLVVPPPGARPIPLTIEITVYRIVQEALTNILKYAQATLVSIIVEPRGAVLRVIVEDDGVGFDRDQAQTGTRGRHVGLIGMRERAALVGGMLMIESAPGQGTTVFVTIPIPPTPR